MTLKRIALLFIKTVFRSSEFWVWSIVFMMFWSAMGAYVFSRNITKERLLKVGVPEAELDRVWSEVVKGYSASWFASIVAVSLASTAGGLVSHVYYSTIPIRFLSKFSKSSSRHLFTAIIAGAVSVFLLNMLILYITCTAMFSHRFGVLILPENPIGVVAVGVVYGLTLYLLAMTLGLLVVALRRPGLLSKISYVPLTFGLAFVMLSIYVGGGYLYLVPFNSAMALIYYYCTNIRPPYDEPLAVVKEGYTQLDPAYAWLVMVCWLLLLTSTSIALLRWQKGVPAEEIIPN